MTQLATSKIFSVNAVNKIEIVKELVALKNTVKERTFNSQLKNEQLPGKIWTYLLLAPKVTLNWVFGVKKKYFLLNFDVTTDM